MASVAGLREKIHANLLAAELCLHRLVRSKRCVGLSNKQICKRKGRSGGKSLSRAQKVKLLNNAIIHPAIVRLQGNSFQWISLSGFVHNWSLSTSSLRPVLHKSAYCGPEKNQ